VLISLKKISIRQLELLIEKIIARVRLWSYKNLSYAGRMQLINARARLCKVGLIANTTCVLCHQAEEDFDHLFFECH
ncbi:hypothetical protein RDABS01_036453, partial [Bienertia sinuspersici]